MRTFTIASIVGAFALGLIMEPVLATTFVTEDGAWWNSVPVEARAFVIGGMQSAYVSGYAEGQAEESLDVIDALPHTKANDALENKLTALPDASFSKSFGSYIDGITDFYVNNPDLAPKLLIGQVFSCLRDNAEVTCDDLARDTRLLPPRVKGRSGARP